MNGDGSLQHLKPEENSALSYLKLNMILSNGPGTHRNYTDWTKGKIHLSKLRQEKGGERWVFEATIHLL